ncbi:MAG: site-2 protease family protein, partial [bacterium]
PLSNFILAFIASFFFVASLELTGNIYIAYFFGIAVFMNVLLGFFNLIPIPPLDGSKILMGLLPPSYDRIFLNIERYGFFILIFLMITGILRILLFPVFSIVNLFLFIPNMIF